MDHIRKGFWLTDGLTEIRFDKIRQTRSFSEYNRTDSLIMQIDDQSRINGIKGTLLREKIENLPRFQVLDERGNTFNTTGYSLSRVDHTFDKTNGIWRFAVKLSKQA
jgi:hypothetical protein